MNIFDDFFVSIRAIKGGQIVYPFHTTFMTKEETDAEFETLYGELDEPMDQFTHYGIYKSKASQRYFAMPLTKDQFKQQKAS